MIREESLGIDSQNRVERGVMDLFLHSVAINRGH
jgi:hypothetical protein